MHFKIAKSAQSYFNNIMNLEGSHAAEEMLCDWSTVWQQ